MEYMFVRKFEIWKGWSRYTRSQKLQTLISVIGLSVGMVCFALSALWLRYIESFENFVPDAERVYLLGTKKSLFSFHNTDYRSFTPNQHDMYADFPEIERLGYAKTSQFYLYPDRLRLDDGTVDTSHMVFASADSDFLKIFGVEILEGKFGTDKNTDVIISQSVAKRLFGDGQAVGSPITLEYSEAVEGFEPQHRIVSGVMADWPSPSQFALDIVFPDNWEGMDWSNFVHYSILKLQEGADVSKFESKYRESLSTKHSYFHHIYGMSTDLLPIRELYSKYSQETESIKLDYIRLFMFLGLLVIVCSLCNYLFTMISNMHIRARNISLHRLLGASKGQLVLLTAFDTLLILILSSVVGYAFIFMLMPVFKEYSMVRLPSSVIYTDVSLYIGAVVVVCVVCSSLTTLAVQKVGDKAILQGRTSHRASRKIDFISNVLQLTLSMTIMICVAVMLLQIRYLTHTTALGFGRDNLVEFTSITDDLEQKIKSSPLVEDYIVDIGFVYPKTSIITRKVWLNDSGAFADSTNVEMDEFFIDEKQVNMFSINVLEGSLPKPNSSEVAINEAGAKALGLDAPLGVLINETYNVEDVKTLTITGLIADIYTNSPIYPVMPMLYTHSDDDSNFMKNYLSSPGMRKILVKVKPGHKEEFLEIANEWIDEIIPEEDRFFYIPDDIEEEYNKMFISEMLLIKLLIAMALSTVVISLIGVYSTLSLSLQDRRKEIALRKIHGAKPSAIVGMFIISYLRTLFVAILISIPISFITMTYWLEAYPKHIVYPWWIPIVVSIALLIMILATVINKVLKASRENPADVIKE